jgi:plasmid stabilization system protein ParE
MAIARVIRSDPANGDLDGIWDYLAEAASPEIAIL